MAQLDARNCPICGLHLVEPPSQRERPGADLAYYHCPRCGQFGLTRTMEVNLRGWLEAGVHNSTIFGHALRRMQLAQEWPLVGSDVAKRIMTTGSLPTPQEQADNLVRWLGDHLPGPGERQKISFLEHGAILGSFSMPGFLFIVQGLMDAGMLHGDITVDSSANVTLTFAGWGRYEEIRRGAPSGRNAFMALEYGDPTLDRIVDEYFRPAVAETGFTLKRLDDDPKAGLIDDRLRVEIQAAQFVIVDLTHGNRGAFWEAGYAEGLSKPVIYTCERSAFQAASHFDTNHHLHVLWGSDDLKRAAEDLKATIRATMPEAKRQDD